MRERTIERKLRQKTEAAGGLALKMNGVVGIPDRILLLPGGRVAFAETKTADGRLTERQKFMQRRLGALGFTAEVIRDDAGIETLLGDILKGENNKNPK